MLIIKEDKSREDRKGQIFVELTRNRDLSVTDCDRLGYWCDKAHLKHFLLEIKRVFPEEELRQILFKEEGIRGYVLEFFPFGEREMIKDALTKEVITKNTVIALANCSRNGYMDMTSVREIASTVDGGFLKKVIECLGYDDAKNFLEDVLKRKVSYSSFMAVFLDCFYWIA